MYSFKSAAGIQSLAETAVIIAKKGPEVREACKRFAHALGVGLEDFLFSFISGGLIWMYVIFVMRRNMKFQISLIPVLIRFFYCCLFIRSIL